MKMNPEIKKRWVDALRSGEYQQTHGNLWDSDGFCCLGVLSDLAVKDGVVEWDLGVIQDPETDHRSAGLLHDKVIDWAGLERRDPEVTDQKDRPTTLSIINDMGEPFTVIADIIEEQL